MSDWRLWQVNGFSVKTRYVAGQPIHNVGTIGFTTRARTEAEALGYIYAEMQDKHPEVEVRSLHARDITEIAREFVQDNPA